MFEHFSFGSAVASLAGTMNPEFDWFLVAVGECSGSASNVLSREVLGFTGLLI